MRPVEEILRSAVEEIERDHGMRIETVSCRYDSVYKASVRDLAMDGFWVTITADLLKSYSPASGDRRPSNTRQIFEITYD